MTQLSLSRKLAVLSDAAKYDASCASSGTVKRSSAETGGIGSTEGSGICHSYAPDGRCISLLKILLTNFCVYDCIYCVNRSSSNVQRARFSVEEVVRADAGFLQAQLHRGSVPVVRDHPFAGLHHGGDGAGGARTARGRKFGGYIHLKVIPNAAPELLAEAARYADRLSTNIELPTDLSLEALAPEKKSSSIRTAMAHIAYKREESRPDGKVLGKPKPTVLAPAGQSTQMIIGADAATDATILERSASLYSGYGLKRVYYSAFSPIPDASSRLPLAPPPLLREHRLYQADWLLRFYGFDAEEIVSGGQDGLLDLQLDPKLAWALGNRGKFPVDVNRAEREVLLRVPGLGVKVIDRILTTRRHHKLRLSDLGRMCGSIEKVRPFIEAADWTPGGLTDAVGLRGQFDAQAGARRAVLRSIHLSSLNDFEEWRAAARGLLLGAALPDDVVWVAPNGAGDLFAADEPPVLVTGRKVGTVPEKFLELGEAAICHSDPERFALLYRLLWRLMKDRTLLGARSDPDVGRLDRLVSAVRRDAHKMTAFVRFKSIVDDSGLERFAAWFEPEHYVLERVTPFFVRRFTGMMWAIITPYRSAYWNGETVEFGPGGEKADVPAEDAMEPVWRSYFASIFNPARLKVAMMKSEMPVKYWRNLPEAELIPSLIRGAKEAEEAMIERQASIPPSRHLRQMERQAPADPGEKIGSLSAARQAVDSCKRCALYEHATQAVFGEGPETARCHVCRRAAGRPGGSGGKTLYRAGRAGVRCRLSSLRGSTASGSMSPMRSSTSSSCRAARSGCTRRPNAGEVQACKFWLGLEREFVRPRLIVAMGATAVSSLLGSRVALGAVRSRLTVLEDGTRIFATVHPSYLLRIPDREMAAAEQQRFEDDLREVKRLMGELK